MVHDIWAQGFKLDHIYCENKMHIWLNGKLEYSYLEIKMHIWLNGELHPEDM